MIPEFPRKYVWKKSKAPLLIDSLYRGFPVSSLLLWQSDGRTRLRPQNRTKKSGRGCDGKKAGRNGFRQVTAAILGFVYLENLRATMVAKTR